MDDNRNGLLSAIINASLDCIVAIDEDSTIVVWNPAAEQTFGYTAAEAIGQPITDLIIPTRHGAAHHHGLARYLREGTPHMLGRRIETEARCKDGREIPIELAITEVDADSRRLFTASLRDLSERRQSALDLAESNARLAHAEKISALGSLLAGVSHELNNPLAVVVGEAILMEDEAQGTDYAMRAGRIRRSAERCNKVVQTFLAMARQRPPELRRTQVNDVVRAAIDLSSYAMASNGITVTLDLDPDLPEAQADPDLVHQVIVNLLVNARQALESAPGEREIVIASHRDESMIVVAVSDNGPGIDEAVASRIFDPFFTTKPKGSGTGIGLSFSRGVIESHGGKLCHQPAAQGACFVIRLPLGGVDAAPSSDIAASATKVAGRALVIDDEPDLARLLGEMVQRAGYGVEVVGSGEAAVSALAKQSFDLILSDIRMPGLDGPALARWIEQHQPDRLSRLAFVTGDTMSAEVASFLESCGRPHAEKPITPNDLIKLIASISAGASSADRD